MKCSYSFKKKQHFIALHSTAKLDHVVATGDSNPFIETFSPATLSRHQFEEEPPPPDSSANTGHLISEAFCFDGSTLMKMGHAPDASMIPRIPVVSFLSNTFYAHRIASERSDSRSPAKKELPAAPPGCFQARWHPNISPSGYSKEPRYPRNKYEPKGILAMDIYGYLWISMDQQPGTLCLCHVVSRHWRFRKEQSHIIPQLAIYFGGSQHLTQPLEIPAFSAVDSASPLSAKANAFTSRPWWLRNPLKMGIQPAFYRLFQHENYGFHRISLINESMMVGWWWVRGLLV